MKFAILTILGVFTLTSFVESRYIDSSAKTNCYIKYLKSIGKLDENFEEDSEGFNNDIACDFESLKQDIYRESALTIRRKTEFGKNTKCIMSELRSKNWAETQMLDIVYASLDAESNANKYAEKIAESEAAGDKIGVNAFFYCLAADEFGEMFDKFIEDNSSSSEEDDPVEEYCVRKYVVDNNLIDTTKYNLALNPKNIDVSNVNCDEIIAKTFKDFEKSITKTLIDDDDFDFNDTEAQCTLTKYREGNFGPKFMVAAILGELNLSAEGKAEEKKKFIDAMYEVVRMYNECH